MTLLLLFRFNAMSNKDIKKMVGSLVIILIHVIKIVIEQRTTPSWNGSIYSRLITIKRYNTSKNNSYVIKQDEWFEILQDNLETAIDIPSWECLNGLYKGEASTLIADLNINEVYELSESLLRLSYTKALSKDSVNYTIDKYLNTI